MTEPDTSFDVTRIRNWPSLPVCLLRKILTLATIASLAACGGGGGGSDDSGTSATPATLQLNDGEVLNPGNSVIRIAAGNTVAQVTARLRRQGNIDECRGVLDTAQVADSLFEACVADQPSCSVSFLPDGESIVGYPPPLYAPVGCLLYTSPSPRD